MLQKSKPKELLIEREKRLHFHLNCLQLFQVVYLFQKKNHSVFFFFFTKHFQMKNFIYTLTYVFVSYQISQKESIKKLFLAELSIIMLFSLTRRRCFACTTPCRCIHISTQLQQAYSLHSCAFSFDMVIETPLSKLLDLEIGFGILNLLLKIMTVFFSPQMFYVPGRPCSKSFACTNSFDSPNNPLRQGIRIISFLAGVLRHREVKCLAQSHTAGWRLAGLESRLPGTLNHMVCCLQGIRPSLHLRLPRALIAGTEEYIVTFISQLTKLKLRLTS